MRRGQLLMLVGVLGMVAGAFGMGATLRRTRPVLQMEPVQVTAGYGDAGVFETMDKLDPLPTKAPKAFDPSERRGDFRAQMDLLAMDIGIKAGDNITVAEIMFAGNNNAKADAAIVLMKSERGGDTTGLFFIYEGVKGWHTFPSDFR